MQAFRALIAAALALPALAPAQTVVYKCPGNPVLYTDSLTAAEAKAKGCSPITNAPVTVIQSPQRARPAPAAGSAVRVSADEQRARDGDARRILADELAREEARLAALRTDYNGGQPERNGDDRNGAKYQDRVADMKAAIERKEADIAALKRELAKLPVSQ